jgi:hypothetical protein
LPASLTSIGDRAFRQDVKEVHSKIKEPFETLAFSTSSGGHHDRILYVPSATKEKYVNCFGWGNYFKEIIEESETYSLQITATGNGSATYNSTAVRGKTQAFTVNEGSSAKVTFAPDAGYRIASVKVNGTDVTSNVANNQYTISNISTNTTLKVMFDVGLSDGDVFTAKTAEGVDMTFNPTLTPFF